MKIANRSFEDMAQSRYLGTQQHQNLIQEEITRRFNSHNACYHSVQNLKNVKIRIYKNITLSGVLYGCETWSLTLRQVHKMGVFENMVLGRISRERRDEMVGGWRKLRNEEHHDSCTLRHV
jgi:hypothetical protein